MTHPSLDTRDDRLLWVGMSLWLIAFVVLWPAALSFNDEVGYLAQAKLLLQGHLQPLADTPGVWHLGDTGRIAKPFPLLFPILILPLVALDPRLVFITGLASTLAITWVASRVLRAWGHRPIWALIVLAHPTVVLIARTAMADLVLSASALGAWWAIRRNARVTAVILLVLVVGSKAVGPPLAAAIVCGEALRSAQALLARDREALIRMAWAGGGLALGLVCLLALNFAASGKLWFSYDHQFLHGPPFAAKYIPVSAPKHVTTLLLMPPLLFVGAYGFWKRREFGPLLLIVGFTVMMCSYYFVDTGRSRGETMVLSARLLLPVISFLLIGYADLLGTLAQRLPRLRFGPAPVLIVLPTLVALAIAVRHDRWLAPRAEAREAAAAVTASLGVSELGLTESAFKAGLLFAGPTPNVEAGTGTKVVLCYKRSPSYRGGELLVPCDLRGYDVRVDRDEFRVLVRSEHASAP